MNRVSASPEISPLDSRVPSAEKVPCSTKSVTGMSTRSITVYFRVTSSAVASMNGCSLKSDRGKSQLGAVSSWLTLPNRSVWPGAPEQIDERLVGQADPQQDGLVEGVGDDRPEQRWLDPVAPARSSR